MYDDLAAGKPSWILDFLLYRYLWRLRTFPGWILEFRNDDEDVDVLSQVIAHISSLWTLMAPIVALLYWRWMDFQKSKELLDLVNRVGICQDHTPASGGFSAGEVGERMPRGIGSRSRE